MKFEDPYDAEAFLKENNYSLRTGIIRLPTAWHQVTVEEGAAIDYLCDEWDYSFMGDYEE